MNKILLGAVLGYIAYRLVRRALSGAQLSARVQQEVDGAPGDGRRVIEGGVLVECARCETMAPQNAALYHSRGGRLYYYCSESCLAADARR